MVGAGLGVRELVVEADVVLADAGDDGVAHPVGCEWNDERETYLIVLGIEMSSAVIVGIEGGRELMKEMSRVRGFCTDRG